MRTQFKLLFVLLIAMQIVSGQNVKVYSKSLKTDKNTTVYIEIPDGAVKFVVSPDDNIHIDYDIDFIKLPKKEHKRILDSTRIEATLDNNHISIKKYPNIRKSSSVPDFINAYSLDNLTYSSETAPKKVIRKLKQDISNKITVLKSYKSSYEEYVKIKYADDLKRKERLLKKAVRWQNNRNFKRKFIIKVPKEISLKIVAKGSLLNFHDEFKNQLSIRLDYGRLYINRIENPKNELTINNSLLIAHEISGGKLDADRVFKALISELNNVDIKSEFSKIEIGKLGKGNKIIDFNSKYFIYNFHQNFGRFSLETDYSEINLFCPKNKDYYIETFGHNTVHYNNNIITKIPPSRKNESSKMMSIGSDTSSNKIKINTAHGIIRFGEDFIDIEE